MYLSTKTYGHEVGLSCAFRQWRANSHCNKLHGYALSFRFIFQAKELDSRNWVIDFGGLKGLKSSLEATFDHKTLVANDDPELAIFKMMHNAGVADLVFADKVGCEAFAQIAFILAKNWLASKGETGRVSLLSCTVAEHDANSAIYTEELNG